MDDNYDELFYTMEEVIEQKPVLVRKMKLPAVVQDYAVEAEQISYFNEVPAAVSFFVVLGQIVKDMVASPNRKKTDDVRIQFLWLQTSGTGKSTLNDWFIPLANKAFEKLNEKHGTNFNIFETTEYTDAALIGSMDTEEQQVEDENGNMVRVKVDVHLPGELEGEGLALWDEFQHSGIFKQSQHKEGASVYLQKFMNTLWGKTYLIKKKLRLGTEPIVCDCRRSVFACSFIPTNLNNVIAEKGVLQRKIMFIQEVEQEIQGKIRTSLIDDWGIIEDSEVSTERFSNNFVKLYECVKERFDEVDGDPQKTVVMTQEARDAMKRECYLMEQYILDMRPEVVSTMNTFINRTLKHMQKLSILCCIAEAPSVANKDKRFRVTANNVIQASSIIRQCYKSLVDWLDEALVGQKSVIQEKANLTVFKAEYRKLAAKTDDGWVNKTTLRDRVMKATGKKDGMFYKWWKQVNEYFETMKIAKSNYVRLLEDKQ